MAAKLGPCKSCGKTGHDFHYNSLSELCPECPENLFKNARNAAAQCYNCGTTVLLRDKHSYKVENGKVRCSCYLHEKDNKEGVIVIPDITKEEWDNILVKLPEGITRDKILNVYANGCIESPEVDFHVTVTSITETRKETIIRAKNREEALELLKNQYPKALIESGTQSLTYATTKRTAKYE